MFEVPDYRDDVEQANLDLGNAIARGAAGAYSVVNLAAICIRNKDTRVGVLFKDTGNNYLLRSVDCLAIKTGDGRVALVDVILRAGSDGTTPDPQDGVVYPPAEVAWQETNEREWLPEDRWREPFPVYGSPQPESEPEPEPDEPGPSPAFFRMVDAVEDVSDELGIIASELELITNKLEERLSAVTNAVTDNAKASRETAAKVVAAIALLVEKGVRFRF
jgi:hypothetical protein